MRWFCSSLALLVLSGWAFAAPPKLVIPSEVKPVDGYVTITPDTDCVSIVYISVDGLSPFPSALLKDSRYLIVPTKGEKAGRYRFIAVAASKTGEQVRVDFVVVVGDPKPTPPQPDPVDPSVAPIPVAGLRVLIVYESADLPKLPPAQQAIIYSKQVRDYLNDKCVVGDDGKTKEFRMWDKDTDTGGESKLWQDAMKRPRTGVPWLVISNGAAGYEGPLPKTVEEFLALVKKYEVPK